jgi:DNA-binding transcriptional LysR family regulator
MASVRNWEGRIGRRVRLRDLHVLFAVVQHGSMTKAGGELGMSQSAVSQAIAALEHALRVPLLDRTPHGVEITRYGAALMRRGQAAFDELRSGVHEIEVLADPDVGDVRIACGESIAAGILPSVIERFCARYPKVRLEVLTSTPLTGFSELQQRKADVLLTLLPNPEAALSEELHGEVWFHDRICLAAARESAFGRRRKIRVADLANAALLCPPADTPGGAAMSDAIRAAGLRESPVMITTLSVHLRAMLAAHGHFVAVLPASILRCNPGFHSLRELPVELSMPQPPALIVTLKNRTLSPPVERFIACARELAQTPQFNP